MSKVLIPVFNNQKTYISHFKYLEIISEVPLKYQKYYSLSMELYISIHPLEASEASELQNEIKKNMRIQLGHP